MPRPRWSPPSRWPTGRTIRDSSIAAHNALALVAAAVGETPAALEHGLAALVEARRTGDLHLEAAVESNLADVLHAAGRDGESREHQLRAVALFAEVGGRPR